MAYAGKGMAAMARPCKQRRICSEPACRRFEPEKKNGDGLSVTMTFDEYETIRLIDYQGFSQEACSEYMHIARTTVQQIYTNARKKLSIVLVEGLSLKIEGGDYQLCDGKEISCGCGGCQKSR